MKAVEESGKGGGIHPKGFLDIQKTENLVSCGFMLLILVGGGGGLRDTFQEMEQRKILTI